MKVPLYPLWRHQTTSNQRQLSNESCSNLMEFYDVYSNLFSCLLWKVKSHIRVPGLRYPFVPSRFEGLIGVYHQSLATGAGLPVTLADARCSLELATALNPLPGWVANRFLPRGGAERQAAFGINKLLTTVGQDRLSLAPSLFLRSGYSHRPAREPGQRCAW